MILPFSTKIDYKPTYFVQKIWKGLEERGINFLDFINQLSKENLGIAKETNVFAPKTDIVPKITSIREDANNRWEAGKHIHFIVNNRQKNMFQFAPVVAVKMIQPIEISWIKNYVLIYIDEKIHIKIHLEALNDMSAERNKKMLMFAQNDGFDGVRDFFHYFNKDFKGKIIHWTDLEYIHRNTYYKIEYYEERGIIQMRHGNRTTRNPYEELGSGIPKKKADEIFSELPNTIQNVEQEIKNEYGYASFETTKNLFEKLINEKETIELI